MGEAIEELKNELYQLMQKETIWSAGRILALSQKLDILIANYYLVDKSA